MQNHCFFQIEALHMCAVGTSLLSRLNKWLHIWEVQGLGIGPAVGYSGDIQDVSWVVDITVHDYFLGVCFQKSSLQHGPYSYDIVLCVFFNSGQHTPVLCSCNLYRVHYNATQPWTAGKWCKQILRSSLHSSQPSREVCCSQGCGFLKPTLSIGHFKLTFRNRASYI
jgi:hypothetical protein